MNGICPNSFSSYLFIFQHFFHTKMDLSQILQTICVLPKPHVLNFFCSQQSQKMTKNSLHNANMCPQGDIPVRLYYYQPMSLYILISLACISLHLELPFGFIWYPAMANNRKIIALKPRKNAFRYHESPKL